MFTCNLCPRKCNTQRKALTDSGKGFCNMGENPVVARAAVHFWEEPPISGTNGSGTVFFSGCNLKCVFCQNENISSGGFGKEITIERLREVYFDLIKQGAHNINLVTGTHFINAIAKSLEEPLPIPVVYNCGGYESVNSLKLLENKVQIYLPDLKYANNDLAIKYSDAPDYFEIATNAIKEMYRQVEKCEFDDNGIMTKGVIIRHLILPNNLENTKRIIDWVKEYFNDGEVLFSLMSQFTPNKTCKIPELSRRLTQEEYDEIEEYLFRSGIEDGFMQELSSAKEEYIPPFNLEGV
ncbi:MAG: 4Fe-4S cluster-binding domain-containing protein [Acutalibacteraceae bacterium]|nr:4Fe-4S cluster-binding domain-containing protein [Acutalibacteraceae bacterium]